MSVRAEDLIRETGHGFGAHSRRPAQCRSCGRPESVHERTESGWLIDEFRRVEPVEHARLAAEAVRALCHVTVPGVSRLEDAADADAVLTALSSLLSSVPQALTQVSGWLVEQADAGRLGDDRGQDPAPVAARAQDMTGAAAVLAAQVRERLDVARQDTSRLFGGAA